MAFLHLQAAVDLADSGHRVMIVERDVSIGGRMIALSKVFPTLDCSSCITTPKMAETAHHHNIEIRTWSEITEVSKTSAGFDLTVVQKPRYVIEDKCIGCRLCEYACPVFVPDDFECGQGARKAAWISHSNAFPQIASIDLDNCIYCGKCIRSCPTDAIDFLQEPVTQTVQAGAIILATGFDLIPAGDQSRYGAGKLPNVISPLLMERLIAPQGPYGKVMRPSDGRIPDSIAYVQCAGSRDKSVGYPYCSRVCCMYAIKQAILVSGSLPMVDVTIYYMDIRAFGKGFEPFYQDAKAMGIQFVCSKVASISEDEDHNPIIRVERKEDGSITEEKHDLVILSEGLKPAWKPDILEGVDTDLYGFIDLKAAQFEPTCTTAPGIFVAGVAAAPKDIVDSVVEASAAASQAASYLIKSSWSQVVEVPQ